MNEFNGGVGTDETIWCLSPNADSILRATQDVQRELNSDCNLGDLNIIYNGLEGQICGGLDCVKTLAKQHKQLTIFYGNIVMKAKTETESIADYHGGTEENLVTAQGSQSKFGSLESLLKLEQKQEMVTTISVQLFPGVLQTKQKYIGKWREAIEVELNIRHSQTYRRPSGVQLLVGSTLAPMCKSRYPVHFVAVDVMSTRTIVDQALSVPKSLRLARMLENRTSYCARCSQQFQREPRKS